MGHAQVTSSDYGQKLVSCIMYLLTSIVDDELRCKAHRELHTNLLCTLFWVARCRRLDYLFASVLRLCFQHIQWVETSFAPSAWHVFHVETSPNLHSIRENNQASQGITMETKLPSSFITSFVYNCIYCKYFDYIIYFDIHITSYMHCIFNHSSYSSSSLCHASLRMRGWRAAVARHWWRPENISIDAINIAPRSACAAALVHKRNLPRFYHYTRICERV